MVRIRPTHGTVTSSHPDHSLRKTFVNISNKKLDPDDGRGVLFAPPFR
jgi:hypothetical protein